MDQAHEQRYDPYLGNQGLKENVACNSAMHVSCRHSLQLSKDNRL